MFVLFYNFNISNTCSNYNYCNWNKIDTSGKRAESHLQQLRGQKTYSESTCGESLASLAEKQIRINRDEQRTPRTSKRSLSFIPLVVARIRSPRVYKRGTRFAPCARTGCRKMQENKMPGNIRPTSSNLLLTCYLVVRFTPTMNVGSFAERPARGERRKEGRKGHRRKENWWGWTAQRPYTPPVVPQV